MDIGSNVEMLATNENRTICQILSANGHECQQVVQCLGR